LKEWLLAVANLNSWCSWVEAEKVLRHTGPSAHRLLGTWYPQHLAPFVAVPMLTYTVVPATGSHTSDL
jgi:hypothetical protein